jgi:hypothetical protein
MIFAANGSTISLLFAEKSNAMSLYLNKLIKKQTKNSISFIYSSKIIKISVRMCNFLSLFFT